MMQKHTACKLFESLASPVRLDIFRLLIKHGGHGLVAGEIAEALTIAPSNLSFHLKALTHTGLISAKQEGRFQRYRANLTLMLDLMTYLTEECCINDNGNICANHLPAPCSATTKPG